MSVWSSAKYCFGGKRQRQFIGQMAIFLLLCGGLASLWSSFKGQILEREEYIIAPERVNIYASDGETPWWVPDDFFAEVLESRPQKDRDKPLNSNDPNLVKELTQAFADHPLVEKVESMLVSYPASLDVVLKFREPIALVDSSPREDEDFLKKASELFPDAGSLELLRLDASLGKLGGTKSNGDRSRLRIVDARGNEIDFRYFRNRPDKLKQFPTIVTYVPLNDALKRAAALVDLLNREGAIESRGIETIRAFKAVGEKEPIFFLTAKDGTTVNWGTFEDPPKSGAEPRYDGVGQNRDGEAARKKLYQYQRQKLDRWKEEGDAKAVDVSRIGGTGSEPARE
ncbi:MAG: hypothetical protein IJM30_00730 [Thermoguttaceae bacterium]|nr:hypothetical protein [Thermoguttaceae bacterium]